MIFSSEETMVLRVSILSPILSAKGEIGFRSCPTYRHAQTNPLFQADLIVKLIPQTRAEIKSFSGAHRAGLSLCAGAAMRSARVLLRARSGSMLAALPCPMFL